MSILKKENAIEPVKCPFCGSKTVLGTVLTTFAFKSEHTLYTNGVDMDGATIGEMLGEPLETAMKYTRFRCTSCNKEWKSWEYQFIKDVNGIHSFVKQEKKKGK